MDYNKLTRKEKLKFWTIDESPVATAMRNNPIMSWPSGLRLLMVKHNPDPCYCAGYWCCENYATIVYYEECKCRREAD